MALITPGEILDLVIMVAAIGFIFKDYLPGPSRNDDYDPLEAFRKGGFFAAKYFKGFKQSVIVAAPAVVLHEAAHKISAVSFGFEATFHAFYGGLGLGILLKLLNFPFLFFIPGFVSYSAFDLHPLVRSFIAFAGPLANLLLFSFAALALKKDWFPKHVHLLSLTKQINLFLFVFNLLPFGPFDGADVFGGLFEFLF